MELLKSVISLIFDTVRLSNVSIVTALLIFYLVIAAIIILIKIAKGVRKW